MERQMEPCQLIERSIIKKYRKELWTPFIAVSYTHLTLPTNSRV